MSFRLFASIALLGLYRCDAQNMVAVQPSQVSGIDLIGPRDPRFGGIASRFFSGRLFPFLNELLPLSVFLVNTGPSPIIYYGIRFEYLNQAKEPVVVVAYKDLRAPIFKHFSSADIKLVSIQGHLSDAVEVLSPEQLQGIPLLGIWVASLRQYSMVPGITASLDCAVFADGRFAGPDRTGQFPRLLDEAAAYRQTVQEFKKLRGGPESTIASALREIIAARTSEVESPFSWNAALRARQYLARNAQRRLERGGLRAFFEYVDNVFVPENVWR